MSSAADRVELSVPGDAIVRRSGSDRDDTRSSGFFDRDGAPERASRGPDPIELALEAREQTGANGAGVVLWPTPSIQSRCVLSCSGASLRAEPGIDALAWLGWVTDTRLVPVPRSEIRWFGTLTVLAVPIASPLDHYGVVAVSTPSGCAEHARLLEALATDFALRIERADWRAQLDTFELMGDLARI